MSAKLLDGKGISKEIQKETKVKVEQFIADHGKTPVLAAVLVGDDPASQVYVRNKERACARAGIESQLHRLPATSTTEDILAKVVELNENSQKSRNGPCSPRPPKTNSRPRQRTVECETRPTKVGGTCGTTRTVQPPEGGGALDAHGTHAGR